MSLFGKNLLCGLVLATVTCLAGPAAAWHGHFGHGHFGHGHHGGGWGGYGNWGYSSVNFYRPRFGFGFAPYRSFYSSYGFGFPSYSFGYSAYYPSYRASYFAPTAWYGCYVPRTVVSYAVPNCYVVPQVDYFSTCYDPTYNISSIYSNPVDMTGDAGTVSSSTTFVSSSVSPAQSSWSARDSILTRLAAAYPGNSRYRVNTSHFSEPTFAEAARVASAVNVGHAAVGASTSSSLSSRGARGLQVSSERAAVDDTMAERSASTKLVAVGIQQAVAVDVPPELLDSADAIFSAGGFKDAAKAYARLSVRFGVNDELATRRFVALIACGDHEQAAVVMQSSGAAKVSIGVSHLPGGSLATLYGPQAARIAEHCDSLAKYALSRSDQALPLVMVGTWLTLDGQADRGSKFFERAGQLHDAPEIASSQLLVSTRVPE